MHLIQYATEADGPGLGKINVQSFQGRRSHREMFPGVSQARLQEYKAIVGMKHLANPNMHVLKIHDPTSGELVAYGRWQLPSTFGQSVITLSEEAALFAKDSLSYAPQPMNEGIYNAFKKILEDGRKRYTTENDIVLDLLATLPGYQGRGLGSAILKWGTEKADASHLRSYLEATPEGVPVYLKHGWRILEEIVLDYSLFGGVGSENFYLMMREPVSQ